MPPQIARRFFLTVSLAALLVTPGQAAEILERRPDCLNLVVGLDVSGSMRANGFPEAQEALIVLLRELRPCDSFTIIPFSETKLPDHGGELTAENRERVLREAEAFVRTLRPGGRKGDSYGHWTNLDEGADAVTLALLRQTSALRGVGVLITDGISDPDPIHPPVDLSNLAERLPKGDFSFYMIDISGAEVHGLEPADLGGTPAWAKLGTPLVVVPLEGVARLLPILREMEDRERKTASALQPPPDAIPAESRNWPWALGVISVVIGAAFIAVLALRQRGRAGAAATQTRRRVVVALGEEERRFEIPIRVTIGGAESDTIRVPRAKPAELVLRVAKDGTGDFRQGNERGGLYGGRSFALSVGAQVSVRIEAAIRPPQPEHRYAAVR